MGSDNFSVVNFFKSESKDNCGYCDSKNSFQSNGLWAYNMTVMDYQNLIDRGWRRSGQYLYKPINYKTCCPMYTIRCRAADFAISKSQKKVIKRMNNFLRIRKKVKHAGEDNKKLSRQKIDHLGKGDVLTAVERVGELSDQFKPKNASVGSLPSSSGHLGEGDALPGVERVGELSDQFNPKNASVGSLPSSSGGWMGMTTASTSEKNKQKPVRKDSITVPSVNKDEKVDPSTCESKMQSTDCTPIKKAKQIRLENKYQKLKSQGLSEMKAKELTFQTKKKNVEKDLEEFIEEKPNGTVENRLEVRLVRTNPQTTEYSSTSRAAFLLYKKYQIAVHEDDPDDLTKRKYEEFLVNSPLDPWYPEDGPTHGYGSFHQQYWLDGVLVAVGVIDILPYCVSSVYFYYDPDLRNLTLGTYGSLREIAFTRKLRQMCPSLKYYYMGYYIHTCPKMSYKAQYSPSYLLCPDTYTWHPIEKCLPMLNQNKYCRFEENDGVWDENETVDINKVIVLQKGTPLTYQMYRSLNTVVQDEESIKLYARLVGAKCALKMLLTRF